ncbi:MAG: NAD(P)-dependent oxidoreductase [Alphaproteobacteria bacterium]|nr:NAD(P)-dependent oxidoreductase [Alphaproteobacteria bacterium]
MTDSGDRQVKTCLITGAAGDIGGRLRRLMKGLYPALVLTDRVAPKDLEPSEDFRAADLADLGAVEGALRGVDAVVHLGAVSVEGDWESILSANIVGTYNVFEAARRQGVARVVFASSFHTIGFYPRNRRIGTDALVRPDTRYGMSKACGEAMAALYAFKYGVRVLCIRIGNIADKPADLRRLSGWCHPEDLVQLIRIGLEHPDLRHEVVWGISANERAWWDNKAAFRLGYQPIGNAETMRDYALAGQAALPPDPIGDRLQGGPYASAEFVGDIRRIRLAPSR